jgi:cytoskeletal protein RodZ
MRPLGETLKNAREAKGLSIENIARDTNIAQRYLAALESENFELFPAEAYILGFLKNYSEYLGLETGEVMSIYRSMKIQEQPAPMTELLKRNRTPPRALTVFAIALLCLAIVGGGVYFVLQKTLYRETGGPDIYVPASYVLDAGILEERFYSGDTITVIANGTAWKISLNNFGDVITLGTPQGDRMLDMSQPVSFDLNSDGQSELEIVVEDYTRAKSESGARLKLTLLEETLAPGAALPAVAALTDGSAPRPSAAKSTPIFTGQSAYPFTLQINFQNYCMFRWEILRERDRQGWKEQYFSRGENLDIPAQNGIRVWVSNTAAVKIQAIGGGRIQPLELVSAGEMIVVADIAWVREDSGSWSLVVIRLES